MSHRRDQKEALRRERQEREAAAKAAAQRKRMVGLGLAGVLAVAVVAVLILLVAGGGDDGGGGSQASSDVLPDGGSVPEQQQLELRPAAQAAGCELRTVNVPKPPPQGYHTTSLEEKIKYATNPPSGGRHYEIPAEDGAYSEAPPDEALVHALEHGRVIVWFKPSLPEGARADVKALFDEDEYQMIVVPRSKMPYALAATAWNGDPAPGRGQLLLCDKVDDRTWDAVRTFRDENRSRGPEPVP